VICYEFRPYIRQEGIVITCVCLFVGLFVRSLRSMICDFSINASLKPLLQLRKKLAVKSKNLQVASYKMQQATCTAAAIKLTRK